VAERIWALSFVVLDVVLSLPCIQDTPNFDSFSHLEQNIQTATTSQRTQQPRTNPLCSTSVPAPVRLLVPISTAAELSPIVPIIALRRTLLLIVHRPLLAIVALRWRSLLLPRLYLLAVVLTLLRVYHLVFHIWRRRAWAGWIVWPGISVGFGRLLGVVWGRALGGLVLVVRHFVSRRDSRKEYDRGCDFNTLVELEHFQLRCAAMVLRIKSI